MPSRYAPPSPLLTYITEAEAIPTEFRAWTKGAHGLANSTLNTYMSALRRLWERGAFNPAIGPDVALADLLRTHASFGSQARRAWKYRVIWTHRPEGPPGCHLPPMTTAVGAGVPCPPRPVLEALLRIVTTPTARCSVGIAELSRLRWTVVPWSRPLVAIRDVDRTHYLFREEDAAILLDWGCPSIPVELLPLHPLVPCIPGSRDPTHHLTLRSWLRTLEWSPGGVRP